ncbi:hypothetical protein LTR27_004029 [Elasticomyces elasticus]|nr:hypothetical protein LTR27_004029 [Elasticomyces elasticus]
MYQDDLATMGLPVGVEATRIDSQYKNRMNVREAWDPIMKPAASEAASRELLLQKIQALATEIASGNTQQAEDSAKANGPAMTTRKRNRAVAEFSTPSGSEDEGPPPAPKKRTVTSVVIYTATVQSQPRTPKAQKERRAGANILHQTLGGYSVWLTPQEYAQTQKDLVPVPADKAHPPLSLLFRYWDDTSQCPLVNGEFTAKRFAKRHLAPAPLPESDNAYFPWDDVHAHLNRDHTETSFISTSNSLVWVLRLALKEASRGLLNGRITIIDGSRLERSQVLHMQPFHGALCKKFAFKNGAWRYPGFHEMAVYAKIPANAVLHPGVAVDELRALAEKVPMVAEALKFHILEQAGDFRTKLRPMLQAGNIQLHPNVISAIATIIRKLLPKKTASPEHISHLVTDITQGWAFSIEAGTTPTEWQQMSAFFAHVFNKGTFPDTRRQQVVRAAFLDGIKWACGKPNARFTEDSMKAASRKAAIAGLRNPLAILSEEFEAARNDMVSFLQKPPPSLNANNHQRRVIGSDLLTGPASSAATDESPCARRAGRTTVVTPIVNDEDEDADKEIVYEQSRRRRRVL